MDGFFRARAPSNEPVKGYAPGSSERKSIEAELSRQAKEVIEIPCVVGGQEIRTGRTVDVTMPCDHGHVLAKAHLATPEVLVRAAEVASKAQRMWANTPWAERASVFLKAGDLLAGPWRDRINASTMLGQAKTVHQAEIDSACEIIDFWRFNAAFAEQLYGQQPVAGGGAWNRIDYRPLEGFIYAITPFNFTAIGANLPTAPALMGNTVVWKPAATASLSNYLVMKLLEEAGMPPGVINFVPGDAIMISDRLIADRSLAGIHFTGSTAVFQSLWRETSNRLGEYATYPRLVGETGGKDFVLAHPSADGEALATALVRGAFEYQGQKCSAASRAYIPQSLWPDVKKRVLEQIATIRMGDVADFRNFMGAVIDGKSYSKLKGYLEQAKKDRGVTILAGGECDDRDGWFVQPTLIQVKDPKYRTMCEELFGPVLTVYVYPDKEWRSTLGLVNSTSPYGLTGAVWARDRAVLAEADLALRHAAGNYYINDKPTGAVVGQQPFGGSRASGTNDKAGSIMNLMRWVSARTIKETFVPPKDYRYPFMGAQ